MKGINKRFVEILNVYFNRNVSEFARSTGIPQPTLNNIVANRLNSPSAENIEKLLNSMQDINAEWLLTGRGEMEKSEIKYNSGIALQGGIHESKDIKIMQNGNEKVKDELINEKERRIMQYYESLMNETTLFREELNKFHELQIQKDVYIERIIKNSFDRNEKNMERFDKIIEQNQILINHLISINKFK
jgi:transcriptional regulator with XRE-family HTH domain